MYRPACLSPPGLGCGRSTLRVALLTTDNREDYKDYGAAAPCFGTAPEALLQGLALLPGVEVHVVSCTQRPVAAPQKLAANVFFHSLLVSKLGWARTAYQGCIRAVRRRLKAIQPDIVHGQGTERDCALSAVFCGYPNLLTVHGNMRRLAQVTKARAFSYWWLAARLEAFALPRTRGVVCLTRHTQAAVSRLAKRTWVLPNAVHPAFFEVSAQPSPGAQRRILCVGNVCALKNQNAFIRALDGLADKGGFKAVFLGRAQRGEAYADEFFRLVQARPWCTWEGFADREKLKGWYRDASVLALPSLEDNCPMAVLEAMAAGVPVVAARVGGVPDLVEDGKTGFLCEPLDGPSMRRAVEKVLTAPAVAVQVARQAKERARERFHPEVIARRHVEIYREVLMGPAAGEATAPCRSAVSDADQRIPPEPVGRSG
jgi:glycosyltransferase involved in cell wall biosynthesis